MGKMKKVILTNEKIGIDEELKSALFYLIYQDAYPTHYVFESLICYTDKNFGEIYLLNFKYLDRFQSISIYRDENSKIEKGYIRSDKKIVDNYLHKQICLIKQKSFRNSNLLKLL